MVLLRPLTIYSIVKKYVTKNDKESTANILLSIILLHTQSQFIAFDFAIKSLPIIVFYFHWRMVDDSLTFELSSLAPWKLNEKKNENIRKNNEKTAIKEKRQWITLLGALIFKWSMYILKNVITETAEQKLCFLYISPNYFNNDDITTVLQSRRYFTWIHSFTLLLKTFYVNFPFPSITFQK